MATPDDSRVALLVGLLPADWLERYDERAGIRQFCGNVDKPASEVEALLDILVELAQSNLLLVGARPRVFRLSTAEGCQWLLTNDPAAVTGQGSNLAPESIDEDDIGAVLAEQFDGFAFLTTST